MAVSFEKPFYLLVFGSRDFVFKEDPRNPYAAFDQQAVNQHMRNLNRLVEKFGRNIVILEGGANGADAFGEYFADMRGFRKKKERALWKKYGRKKAGPIRNQKMLKILQKQEQCGAYGIWDKHSTGTKHMLSILQKASIKTVMTDFEGSRIPI